MASVETTRVATERGSVRRADGRADGRGDQARERDHSRRHERHVASHARVQSRRWPDPPATQASARRDAERQENPRAQEFTHYLTAPHAPFVVAQHREESVQERYGFSGTTSTF